MSIGKCFDLYSGMLHWPRDTFWPKAIIAPHFFLFLLFWSLKKAPKCPSMMVGYQFNGLALAYLCNLLEKQMFSGRKTIT